jgi:uncharacterized protein (DUF1778 family)
MLKDKRRELRIASKDDDLIVEAAGLLGISVSEFLVERAVSDAEKVVEAHHSIGLAADPYRQFLEALDRPAKAPEELVRQIRESRRIKHPH